MLVQCNVLILHQYLHVYQLQACTRKTFFPMRGSEVILKGFHMYWGIIGDGHQPNSRGLHILYKDFLLGIG